MRAALRRLGENAVADGIERDSKCETTSHCIVSIAVPLEHPACVILTRHHSTLTQSIGKDPIARSSIGGLLRLEKVIDERTLAAVNSARGTEVLLTAVKEAVFVNYQNLRKFAAILQKFTATVSALSLIHI